MDIENLAKELILKNMTPEQQMAVLESVRQSVANAKEVQKKKIGENVDLVVQALKKIESDIRDRFDAVGNSIEKRVLSIKDGRDGANGKDGRDGKDGKSGRDGLKGDRGVDGQAGRDGVYGVDGISVVNAQIDFDGSLVITLSDGRELNVGEVVSADVAEKIKVISTMSTNAAIAVKEEGTTLTNGVKSINFVGTGITATTSGDDVTVTVAGGGGSGTVTSVSALTLGTSGTDLSSTVANSTTTPVITLNVPTASAANRGALSSADWTTFNNKGAGTVTSVAATGGTGISITGSPITTSGTLTITNTAPDQTVALTQGGTTTITGTYPNFTISSADQFQGTVTSVTGTSPVVSSGGATPAISLAASYGDTQNPYASKTANFVLAAPNGSAGVPTFRAIVAADIPTLNQSTTGSAATLTTGRTIAITGDLAYTSPSFDGSTNITAAGTLATVNSNVGSFTAANITVNAKGLITAASSGTAGASISNDTSTATNVFPLFASATTGVPTTIFTGNTKLLYKPSTGELQSTVLVAGNGIVVNSKTVATSYTIASGNSAMSVGTITIASGQSVTVSSGSRWVVL